MSHGKPEPVLRRHNLAEVDAHNSRQKDRLLHPLLRHINEIPADTSQNERDRVAIEGEKNENRFLSLPFRKDDDYFLLGAFGQESGASDDSNGSAEASHQSCNIGQTQKSLRTSAAFDILRPDGKFTSATLGQAIRHQGKRGHHRKKVFKNLEQERHIREQATRPTDLARTSRILVQDAEARHRPKNKKLRTGGLVGERVDGGGPRSPSLKDLIE